MRLRGAGGFSHRDKRRADRSTSAAPIVFFDIAGPDLPRQRQLFADAFGRESAPTGHVSAAVKSPSLNGLLRTDPASCMIYFGVPDVTKALANVVAAGGAINAPRSR